MKKLLAVIIVAMFLASIIPMNATSVKGTAKPSYGALSAPLPKQKTRSISVSSSDIEGIDGTSRYVGIEAIGAQPDTGNTWTVPIIDDYYGGFYMQDFECVLHGTHANIWIGLNDTFWPGNTGADYFVDNVDFGKQEWHFMYPWSFNASKVIDPRYPNGYHDIIYGKNLTYVLNEFDNNIWQKDTEFFGMYADRPGPLSDNKIQVLIFNIRDDLFWDPVTSTSFIEGYFWSFASDLNHANIFHMDTWQWYRRLGPSPQPSPSGGAPRPYEYEGTFAHEFQHLIHHDIDDNEYSWVNEGCSQLAIHICGYPLSSLASDVYYYFAYFWDTSLVTWHNNLENYGVVFLWTYYMHEHYGQQAAGPGNLIWDLVHEPANGIAGYNNVLTAHSYKSFDEIFQDWTIANYLDDGGIYGYQGLVIPSALYTLGWSIPVSMAYWQKEYPKSFNWNPQLQGDVQVGYPYPYGTTLPYTVNYVQFLQLGDHALATAFKGPTYAGVVPHSLEYEWYSDGVGDAWFRLKHTFTIPVGGATLKFWSYYDIEKDYDFGYVEVNDGGQWYTLPGTKTVNDTLNLDGYDNPSCPPQYEPKTYNDSNRWNGFTGSSGGWYQETMDLTPFKGHTIDLYFTYWTDPFTLGLGWYIDDIEITPSVFSDNVEGGVGSWTTTTVPSTATGWTRTTGVYPMYFGVNFIQSNIVTHLTLDSNNYGGPAVFPMINNAKVRYGPVTMIMAAQPGFELQFSTTYRFAYQKIPWVIWK
jgi:hypothetical protein